MAASVPILAAPLVCGVTLAQLAEIGDCSTRTVSRLIAWAQDADLLVVEEGASAAFLGLHLRDIPHLVADYAAGRIDSYFPFFQVNSDLTTGLYIWGYA